MLSAIDPHHQPVVEGSRRTTAEQLGSTNRTETAEEASWLQRARDGYQSSTNWFDASVRKQIERNFSNFHSKHPAGSKYHSEIYQKKSRIFRPKTRSMVRRGEAAMAVAYFSTQDVVNVKAMNENSPEQRDGAEVHNLLLNHRLQHSIPWYQIAIGAMQDAKVTGLVISRQSWQYETRKQQVAEVYEEADGSTTIDYVNDEVVVVDQPRVDLVPLENIRLDPAADWTDPINSSPYLIELVPTYVYEVRRKMGARNPRTGAMEYHPYENGLLAYAIQQDWDSIRRSREGARVDKYEADCYINDYQTVWVHRNYMRVDGRDWCYDTLGTELLLSDPELKSDVYPHLDERTRPYVMGCAILEAHKQYPASSVELSENVQEEINELTNLRMDNVKLTLNRRYFVRRGVGVDVSTLIRNVPASAVLMSDVQNDVREVASPDVTASSYQEQDRLNMEFDEVSGNFSAASVGSNRRLNETVGGMNMLSADANQIIEYEVRTISETWVEQVLAQLVALEAQYETDEEILQAIVARSGLELERILEVIKAPVWVAANVGFNSTNPERRIGKLALALESTFKFLPQLANQIDGNEVLKEVFGAIGYRDGKRFFPEQGNEDPQVTALKQQVQQLQQVIATEQHKQAGRIEVAKIGAEARMATTQISASVQMQLGAMKAELDAKRLELEAIDRQISMADNDTKRKELYLQREALSHSIQQDNREFLLKINEVVMGMQQPENGKGAKNLPGNDKAGVLSRQDYGDIPQAAG